jgi:hypothetical protein
MMTPKLEERVEEILKQRGGGLGLTTKRIRAFLEQQGIICSHMDVCWALFRLRERGKVSPTRTGGRRKLWRLVTYGGE